MPRIVALAQALRRHRGHESQHVCSNYRQYGLGMQRTKRIQTHSPWQVINVNSAIGEGKPQRPQDGGLERLGAAPWHVTVHRAGDGHDSGPHMTQHFSQPVLVNHTALLSLVEIVGGRY